MDWILDFSDKNFKVNSLLVAQSWQQEIVDFIHEYLSDSKEITVKTSGSTGKPKIIKHRKENLKKSAQLTGEFLKLQQGETALLALPVQYIAGKMMVARAIELRLKLICVEPKTQIQFNENSIDFAALTPMQAEKSLWILPRIQKIILGGAQVSPELEKKLKPIANQVFETYAMTETITHIAMRELFLEKVFQGLNQMEFSVDDRNCLQIQTPYFPEVIQTNDVVDLIDSKTFKWKGRTDFVVNSGGVKIHPEEVEKKLAAYILPPFVVHYEEDKILGQKVILIVESETELKIEIPENILSKFEKPKAIYFVKKLPRIANGKVDRKVLKKG